MAVTIKFLTIGRSIMGKAVKWVIIIVGGLIILLIAALLVIPLFWDVQKYKPEIEKRVADATGRPFSIGRGGSCGVTTPSWQSSQAYLILANSSI